jgi:hypothetical protein
VATAFVTLLVLFALFPPLADPGAHLRGQPDGRASTAARWGGKFDFEYLRFEERAMAGGLAGIDEMHDGRTRPSCGPAPAMLKRQNRLDETGALSDVSINLTLRPATAKLPQGFLRQDWTQVGPAWRLPACLKRGRQQCDAYLLDFDGDGKEEVLLISNDPRASSVLLAEKDDGSGMRGGKSPRTPCAASPCVKSCRRANSAGAAQGARTGSRWPARADDPVHRRRKRSAAPRKRRRASKGPGARLARRHGNDPCAASLAPGRRRSSASGSVQTRFHRWPSRFLGGERGNRRA